jgi:ParB family chromosome partitioning protein
VAKNALGKGAAAVFSADDIEIDELTTSGGLSKSKKVDADSLFEVEISQLKANPYQPRKEFDDEALKELSESIKEDGVIEPIIITECADGGYYIVGGERRTRAAKLAGLTKIPACVKKYSPEKMLEVALIENIQRENLNPLEEALAYQKLMEMSNLSQEEVSKRVGKNRSTVANALRLLKLPEDMQRSLSEGVISAGHARAILSVVNGTDQRILFAKITGSGLSVREAERIASEMNGTYKPTEKSSKKTSKKSA